MKPPLSPAVSNSEDIPTLLHFAAQYGLKDLASVLLQCPGAQQAMRSPNRFGHTPLMLAHVNGHSQLQVLLQESLVSSSAGHCSCWKNLEIVVVIFWFFRIIAIDSRLMCVLNVRKVLRETGCPSSVIRDVAQAGETRNILCSLLVITLFKETDKYTLTYFSIHLGMDVFVCMV